MSEIVLKANCNFVDEEARKFILRLERKIDRLENKIKEIKIKESLKS